jgi:hypothetical protein
MQKLRLPIIVLVLILCAVLVSKHAMANLYAGTDHSASYGAWAHISAPATAPYMEVVPNSWQYNWVSIPAPNWIQSGWSLGATYAVPKSYVEICINDCNGPPPRFFQEYADHPYGSTIEYMVEYIPGTGNRWCAYIGGVQKQCNTVTNPPQFAQASSEIIASSKNGLDTTFSEVRYKDSSYIWHDFEQSDGLEWNCPYVAIGQPNNFHAIRGSCTYLPVVIR